MEFWQNLTKADSVELLDKLLLGKNNDGSTTYCDVNQIKQLLAAFMQGAIIPTTVAAGTNLGSPTDAKIYYAGPGSYTTPSGTITLTANLNMLFWDLVSWSSLAVDVSVPIPTYPFAPTAVVPAILANAIKDITLVNANPATLFTLGIVRKKVVSGSNFNWNIVIYSWVNNSFGSKSFAWSNVNYTPSATVERLLLVEATTGEKAYVVVDWSAIPDGYSVDTQGYALTGISSQCYSYNMPILENSVSKSSLDSTVLTKNYPFASTAVVPALLANAIKDITLSVPTDALEYTVGIVEKNNNNTWSIAVYSWENGTYGSVLYSWKAVGYVPASVIDKVVLTANYFDAAIGKIEVVIDWSLLPNSYRLDGIGYSEAGISKLAYMPNAATNESILAAFGDSRIDQSDNNPIGQYDETATYTNKQNYGAVTWAEILTKKRIQTMGYNFGISGQNTQQMFERLYQVLAIKPKACFVWGGINDISLGVPSSEIFLNLRKIYEVLMASDIVVIAVLDNFSTSFSATNYLASTRLNNLIREYAINKKDFHLVDADSVVTDPTIETPTPKAGILYDQTHIGVRGAFRVGRELASILDSIYTTTRTLSIGAKDSYNAVTNPNQLLSNLGFLGTNGIVGSGCSGVVPTGWKSGRTSTQAIVNTSIGLSSEGYPAVIVNVTAMSAGDKFSFVQEVNTSLFTPNSRYKLECQIKVMSPNGVQSIGCFIEANVAGTPYTKGCALDSGQASAGSLIDNFTGIFETPVLRSPTSIPSVSWFLAGVKGSFIVPGSVTVELSRFKLTKL